jgi:engulfment/cell motility protein 1
MGWAIFEDKKSGELVERVVELIVRQPLVNILRGAMGILVAVVGHTQSSNSEGRAKSAYFGFRALKPAVAVYPQFYEMVVAQLGSALCANALMLLNALLRDVLGNDSSSVGSRELSSAKSASSAGALAGSGSEEWGKFIKKLQDLGVVEAVYALMQGSVLQDLAHPLLEFQALSKVMIRKWRETRVDLERPEHRRGLKGIHLASAPEKKEAGSSVKSEENSDPVGVGRKGSRRHAPEKWRRLGFETESPAWEFDVTGFLGLMDLTDYVRNQEDAFQKILLEQAAKPLHERCPIARASLATTLILYDHFEVEHSTVDDAKAYLDLDGMKDYNHIFQPLLLKWSRLHVATLQQFFRLWKATGAEQDDFEKVADLLRILVEQVVGQASRTKDSLDVEGELQDFDYAHLRQLQMQLLELSLDEQWGSHLDEVRRSLKQEALQFVKEQRIRCLLAGSWFPRPIHRKFGDERRPAISWRFLRLSHNRRYLHYADFDTRLDRDPALNELEEKVDLSIVSSVVSNVSAINDSASSISTNSTVKSPSEPSTANANNKPLSKTKITINSFVTTSPDNETQRRNSDNEHPILTLHPTSHSLASEWLDGLLMLLNQAPITSETNKLVGLVGEYGLKIRLLNVKLDGLGTEEGREKGIGVVPSREGLDEDYWFEIGE